MWNPAQYLRYQAERDRPFFDLLARVRGEPRRVVDLGCGTGHLSAALLDRWPQAQVTGLDSSPEMLERAAQHTRPGLSFGKADIAAWGRASWAPAVRPDLIVSNAALQWLPDHEELIPRLAAQLAPGGTLAFQVPGNFDAPSHVLLRELQTAPQWAATLEGGAYDPGGVLSPEDYAGLLSRQGFAVDAWETTYLQLLTGPDAVLEWVRGTALRPTLARLDPQQAVRFEAQYAEALRAAYPSWPDGRTPFPFRRLFVVAVRE